MLRVTWRHPAGVGPASGSEMGEDLVARPLWLLGSLTGTARKGRSPG
jgi:hypothetical protein